VDLDLFGSATFSQVAVRLLPRRMVYESGTGPVHTGFDPVTELEVTVDVLRFQGQTPGLTVKVQHSDDGSSWTDMLTFTGVGEDEETDTFAGDVKDQVRVIWTLSGTNASANFSVSARVLDADAPVSGGSGLPDTTGAIAGDVLSVVDPEGGEAEWVDQLKRVSVTLTDAQIKALPTTPANLVAAPGAGKAILPLSGFALVKTPGYVGYANLDATSPGFYVEWFEGGSSSDPLMFGPRTQVQELIAGDWPAVIYPLEPVNATNDTKKTYGLDDAPGINAALRLRIPNAAAGNFTGGDAANSMIVTLLYVIVDV
jgi:hypothetical protein